MNVTEIFVGDCPIEWRAVVERKETLPFSGKKGKYYLNVSIKLFLITHSDTAQRETDSTFFY